MSDNGSEEGTRGSKPGESGSPEPFIDAVFAALADWRRRAICQYCRRNDVDTVSVERLAHLVSSRTPDTWAGVSRPTPEEVAADLEETHLPVLDEAGVVDFDERSGTVRYWGQPTVEKWAEHADAVDQYEA